MSNVIFVCFVMLAMSCKLCHVSYVMLAMTCKLCHVSYFMLNMLCWPCYVSYAMLMLDSPNTCTHHKDHDELLVV